MRILVIIAALLATLLGPASIATAETQSQNGYFENSIDAFAVEHGLPPIIWGHIGSGEAVETPCGLITSAGSFIFCFGDQTAYIGDDAIRWALQYSPLAPALLSAHEAGHRFQYVMGNRDIIQSAEDGADCVAGAWLRWADHNGYVDVSVFDLPELFDLTIALGRVVEGDVHGTFVDRGVAMFNGWHHGLDYCGTQYMAIR